MSHSTVTCDLQSLIRCSDTPGTIAWLKLQHFCQDEGQIGASTREGVLPRGTNAVGLVEQRVKHARVVVGQVQEVLQAQHA